MTLLTLLSWSSWTLLTVIGLGLFVMRSAETGLSYVSLPRLLYFFWIMLCVMFMAYVKAPGAAAICLLLASAVGVYALIGDEPEPGSRAKEVLERVAGCRRALEENERNPMSLELLGDAYSTIEERAHALRCWERSYAIVPNAKLLEKIERLRRAVPVFFYWGPPCAHELRACPQCERVLVRSAWACACGERFFPDRPTWLAARFNRIWEDTGEAAP
ncbi:MAG: hypothetical protein M0D55_01765 [Elusimicrobiota bacterium]|nr:MAG: hypothetical protein M0D55_01765 [Elusimicrobiota bacterium]